MKQVTPNIHLRSMNFYDNEQVLQLCRESGILLGDQVNCTMIKIDHNCLHVAEDLDKGKIVAVCSGFNISPHLASFGEYAIIPKYRHFGIGNALWKRCVEHCQNRENSVILASAKNVSKYREKSGFTVLPARKLIQFSGIPQLFLLNKYHEQCDIEWINERNIEEITGYDEAITGVNRGTFIKYSVAESSSIGVAARCVESGRIQGYGIFRRVDRSTIVPQPLYANSVDIAEVLIYSALHKTAGAKKLSMECWDVNEDACRILAINRLGLEQIRYCTVMFTEKDLCINFKHIFASSPSSFYPF